MVNKRFDNWNKEEKVCMNCRLSHVCKFAPSAIALFNAKLNFEDVDPEERYNVGIGIIFNCIYFENKSEGGNNCG